MKKLITLLLFNFLYASEYDLQYFLSNPSSLQTEGVVNFKDKKMKFISNIEYSGFIKEKEHMGVIYNSSYLLETKILGNENITSKKTFLMDNDFRITYITIERFHNGLLKEKKRCERASFSPKIPKKIKSSFNSVSIPFNCIKKYKNISIKYIFDIEGYFTIITTEYQNAEIQSITKERFKISEEGVLLDYFNLN